MRCLCFQGWRSQRCSSVATEWIQGKSLDEAVQVKNSDIASHLKLPPVKLHCRWVQCLLL